MDSFKKIFKILHEEESCFESVFKRIFCHFKAEYTIQITPKIASSLFTSQFQQLISDARKTKTTNVEFASKYINLFGIPEVDDPKFSYYL
jgi:hypothetical protein